MLDILMIQQQRWRSPESMAWADQIELGNMSLEDMSIPVLIRRGSTHPRDTLGMRYKRNNRPKG